MDRVEIEVGIVCTMAYPEAMKDEAKLLEVVTLISKDTYFSGIEFGYVASQEIKDRLKKVLKASKLRLSVSGHGLLLSQGLNINDLDPVKRQKAVEALKKGIDYAYEMNGESFSFLSGHYDPEKIDDHMECLIASTKELCEYALSKGDLILLHEGFDHEIDKKSLIGPTELGNIYGQEISKSFDNFGLMIDLSHFPQIGEGIEASIEPIKSYIRHAHIGNCVVKKGAKAYGDQHPRFGFDNSSNDVKELRSYLVKLEEVGYFRPSKNQFVSFEIKPWEDEDPDLVIANAKRTLNEALMCE